MARERITDEDVTREFNRLTDALRRVRGDNVTVFLRRGNRSYKIANKLIMVTTSRTGRMDNTFTTQVWPDAMAGYTTRDAYNALRLMTAALWFTE